MDKFEKEMSKIPLDERCYQTDSGQFRNYELDRVFFGVPSSKLYGREPLETIPEGASSFSFYLGANQEELLGAFTKSSHAEKLEYLCVGDSSYQLGVGSDFSNLMSILSDAEFPRLKSLHLGIWHLFHNAHCGYGRLGDITELLRRSSHVEDLELCGYFELSDTITLDKVKDIDVILDDYLTCINGGAISNSTLSRFLNSQFAVLETLFLDLDCEDGEMKDRYTLTDGFLSGLNTPKLRKLEMSGEFAEFEKERLLNSDLGKREKIVLFLDEFL